MARQCRKRPKRKIPRRFSERDVARILRIICEQKGVSATRRAIGRARVEGKWHQECPYLDDLCDDDVTESLERMLIYARVAESIAEAAQALVETPFAARIIRAIPRVGPLIWAAMVAATELTGELIEEDISNIETKLQPALGEICDFEDDGLPLEDRRRRRPRR